jgi:predicted DNA-binding transcriptional regulator AlpA
MHNTKPSMRLLRPNAVRERLGIRRSTFTQKCADGKFPFKAVKITEDGRAVGFIEAEIDAYIRDLMRKRDLASRD